MKAFKVTVKGSTYESTGLLMAESMEAAKEKAEKEKKPYEVVIVDELKE